MSSDCIFCKIRDKHIPADLVVENDDLFVIKDISPKAPTHYLIIPKKHVQDIQSFEQEDTALAGNLLMMAQQLSQKLPQPGAFRLVVNSGAGAGQEVFHLHLHFLAGKPMSGF